MKHHFGKTIVVALGGSIIFPEQIDAQFIGRFSRFIRTFVKKRTKFVIVIGGGRLSRLFQTAAKQISNITDEDKDWIGIHATRLNAHLLRTVFRDIADPVVLDSRHKLKKLRFPVTIASGWRPGWSTDYVAVALAKDFGAGEVVVAGKPGHVYPHTRTKKITNVYRGSTSSFGVGVYDKDDDMLDTNNPYKKLTWREYRKLIPAKWIPGSHAPVDPVAARLAEKEGIKAIVLNGKDLKNFENLLKGKDFKGTIVGE